MVNHIVMWRFLSEVPMEQRPQKASELKQAIEGLRELIPGVLHLQVELAPIGTSTHDLLLISRFTDQQALDNYQVDPRHVAVAQQVRQVLEHRACFDFVD